MKPETHAWIGLHDHAASLLRPGFAERTLRAARVLAPTPFSQFVLSAATAAACLLVVFLAHQRSTQLETARNLAGWQEIAAETRNLGQLP
jgi:hypothetical protein